MNYDDVLGLVDIPTREQVIDYAASKAEDGMIFIELGVFLGSSVCRLAQKIKDRNINCKIYAIDNWLCHNISPECLNYAGLLSNNDIYSKFISNILYLNLDIIPIQSDTIEAAKIFEDNSIDYIFFDANHGFGLVNELQAWIPKLKEKSLAAVHDWGDKVIKETVIGTCPWYEETANGNSVWIRKTL